MLTRHILTVFAFYCIFLRTEKILVRQGRKMPPFAEDTFQRPGYANISTVTTSSNIANRLTEKVCARKTV